jgi:hypothetical protein
MAKSRPNTVMLSLDDEQRAFVEAEAKRLRLPLATTIKLWITERMDTPRKTKKEEERP